MTPQQILTSLRNGYDTADIARFLFIPEAAVVSALHLAREEEHHGKDTAGATIPAQCKSLMAHHRKWRDVQVAQIRRMAETGTVERAGSGQGEADHRTVQTDSVGCPS